MCKKKERVIIPIRTEKDGNKIAKVCVEDIYKMINRVQDAMTKYYDEAIEITDNVHKYLPDFNCSGELIVGTGVSQPCLTDAFDEEIGNNIAFMKAKLNANLKKHNLLKRTGRAYAKALNFVIDEMIKVDNSIRRDLEGIRKHNPEYLADLETRAELIPDDLAVDAH